MVKGLIALCLVSILGKGDVISPDCKLLDVNENRTEISKIASPQNIYYRVKPIYCQPCVDHDLFLLNASAKKYAKERSFIVLCSFRDFRSLLSLSRLPYYKSLRFYNVPDLAITMDNKDFEGSFFFTLNEQYQVKNLFFSDKQAPSRSQEYLSKILK